MSDPFQDGIRDKRLLAELQSKLEVAVSALKGVDCNCKKLKFWNGGNAVCIRCKALATIRNETTTTKGTDSQGSEGGAMSEIPNLESALMWADKMEHSGAKRLAKEILELKATVAGKDKELFDVREAAEIVSVMDGKRIAMLLNPIREAIAFVEKCDNPWLTSRLKEALSATPSEVDEWWKLELGKAESNGMRRAAKIVYDWTYLKRVGGADVSLTSKIESEATRLSHTPKPDEKIPPSKEGS